MHGRVVELKELIFVPLELIDESEVKPTREIPKKIKNVDIKLSIIPKEDVRSCERVKNGMVNDCAICQALNKEFFDRCNNKWNYE